jgi:predicted glycoside hydrolase/deacetylase ChbG (UPF0249 family)
MPTPRLLIVNADDFGLSPGVNSGIFEAHRNGIVTSTSLMVRQPAAAQAAHLARQHPRLSVGLHLDLCEWVFESDAWQLRYEVVPMNDPSAIEREVLAQLHRFETLNGRPPTHLDSHQHVHRHEPARSIVVREAQKRSLPLRDAGPSLRYCGAFYGQSNQGAPYPEGITVECLLSLIRTLPAGVTELGCHPAGTLDFESVYLRERPVELRSLCDPRVRTALAEAGVRLCSFFDPEVQRLVCATR